MPMHDIDGVVDVQYDGAGWMWVAGAIEIDQGVGQADHLAQVRRIFQARDGRLRAEIAPTVGQASARELEAGISAQMIEVVAVLVAAGDGEHACTQDVSDTVTDERLVRGSAMTDASMLAIPSAFSTAASSMTPPSEVMRGDFLALHRWQREREQGIFDHGGCGSVRFGSDWRRQPNLCGRTGTYATSANESLICGE